LNDEEQQSQVGKTVLPNSLNWNRTFLKQSSILWGVRRKLGTPLFSDFLTGVRGAVYHRWNVLNTTCL